MKNLNEQLNLIIMTNTGVKINRLIILIGLILFLGSACKKDENKPDQSSQILNGLISYWKLDESTGSIAGDETGNWALSHVNAPSWSSAGKINGSIDLGTNNARYLQKTGINSGNKNTYTLAAWVNLADGSSDGKNIMGMNSGGNAINAGAAEVKIILLADNSLAALYHTVDGWSGPMQRISATVLQLNIWYHVAAVFNNGNIELYINGMNDNSNQVTNSINTNLNFSNGRVTVGNARLWSGDYIATRWFRGKIDEAAIWDRPLTPAEIVSLYNNGTGLQHPF